MKSKICITALLSLTTLLAGAQEIVTGVTAKEVHIERNGNYLAVEMQLDLSNLEVTRDRAVLLTPRLVKEEHALDLKSIGIYSRYRYYHYVRNNEGSLLTDARELSYKKSQKPDVVEYSELIPYEEWMEGTALNLLRNDYGCCEQLLAREEGTLGVHSVQVPYQPRFRYVTPEAEVKIRSLEGSAFIDFPVNKTAIDPDYRKNPAELAKIHATIDSVRSDRDVTITTVWLKGYASPEGSYSHNRELALGRVNALKSYVQNLYRFDSGVITTESEAEDWAGLRQYVENSSLAHRTEILALIDGGEEPDAKEARIKSAYPAEYRQLLENCYPALRRTDYRVNYTVRGYSDVEEIREILRTQPQKLSLNEMYLVAQTLEQGSEEFDAVFETAVRMYPDDEAANLNAANIEMKRGNLAAAKRYLDKAGESGEADYARGVAALLETDCEEALPHLVKAREKGVAEAADCLEYIETITK